MDCPGHRNPWLGLLPFQLAIPCPITSALRYKCVNMYCTDCRQTPGTGTQLTCEANRPDLPTPPPPQQPPWENLLPHLTPICPVAVLARCRVSCFCFSQIAPVFLPSTSHVHEQGTGIMGIGEAPVGPPPGTVSWCVPVVQACRGVLAMYLFPPVLVRVHLYSVRTS